MAVSNTDRLPGEAGGEAREAWGEGGPLLQCSRHSDFESDGGGEKNFFKEN